MPNRGSFSRRTGKTTPRNKGKTHWGAGASMKRAPTPGKGGASKPSKAAK
jgi:hypothetical protein